MNQNEQLHELALFAGAGGGILGGKLLGWKCVCAVEIEEYPRRILAARQDDGCLDPFPIWDDVRTFDGTPWRGVVDIITGGFPCQDISSAGKGEGIDGKQSSMWAEMARIVGEVLPAFVLVENSPMLVGRGLARVLGDLASLGYDARWGVVGADAAGAPHKRERIWIVANSQRHEQSRPEPRMRKAGRMGRKLKPVAWNGDWQDRLRELRGMGDGMARNVDRTDAIRNGQVPAVVRLAWNLLR
jgi:DNA (cytosine-5)-methyltransferase 1